VCSEEGHILAFLTGQDEIEKACTLLNKAMDEEQAKLPPVSNNAIYIYIHHDSCHMGWRSGGGAG
jgi:HrpA-like RNA helicase